LRKIINIAHRGFHRDFPENTLEAFEAAVRLGVDGVEFDVQETADEEFVVFHDDCLGGRNITEMTADEVCRAHIGDEYSIPSLEDVLEACGREMILLVELKQVRSLEKLMEALSGGADMKMVVVISFNRSLIKRLDKITPEVMKAVIGRQVYGRGKGAASRAPLGVVSFKPGELEAEKIADVHAAGGLVLAWDCTDVDSVKHALEFEIDGIISDYPDLVIEKATHEN